MFLGCIADDFTGGTDLANMLVQGGMRTIQTIGVPDEPIEEPTDAVVIALKSRTAPPQQAIDESLRAMEWLRANGCRQIYFKYCSTFDSTPEGNIGPVTDALMNALGTDFTIACPAFPENGRTIYQGYLFVGDVLLNESGMRNHPLTPMTDANLVRVLAPQTARQVGLAPYRSVSQGASALRRRLDELKDAGVGIAIVDALADADLATIAEATLDLPLVTAGSGLGLGLARALHARGMLPHAAQAGTLPRIAGAAAVISGSCSTRTNEQVAEWRRNGASFQVDPIALMRGEPVVRQALAWAQERVSSEPVLIYATSMPDEVKSVQRQMGPERAGQVVEQALAAIAGELVHAGLRKLVVAGGETSGAVVRALGVKSLRIGPQIDPGVPWTMTSGGKPILLALKSGNFGTVDFFRKALDRLEA